MKPNQLNTEKFIQRAIDVHNDKYNYIEFNYKQLKHMIKEHFEEMVINKLNEIRSLNA